MNNLYISIIIILILFIIYKYLIFNFITNLSEKLICGFWQAHPLFCEESELDMFCIYLEPGKRKLCWILMVSNDNIISNHFTNYKIKKKFKKSNNWNDNIKLEKEFEIEIKELPDNLKDEFPLTQDIKLYIHNNKITLSKGKKIYFVGYKDSKISDLIDIDIKEKNNK